jgi:diguanylate cyclase (GGDEF)-like protein/PAS domain S-box-containing protein
MLARQMVLGDESSASEALRGTGDETFRRLAEAVGAALFVRVNGQFRYVNHVAQDITGYTREELLSMSFGNLAHVDSANPVDEWEAIDEPHRESMSYQEFNIHTKIGETRCLAVTSAPIWYRGEFARLITAFDITNSKRAEEQAQLLAMTDPLTGLGNYRKILSVLNLEIERSSRTARPFALLLLDVDDFKQINDRFGHLEGNRALCRLGNVAQSCCRAIDTVTRCGGDEFSIILPETSAVAARAVAARIREQLAKNKQPLSVSVGVVEFPKDGETVESLVQAADRQLYQMKKRNLDTSSATLKRLRSPSGGEFGRRCDARAITLRSEPRKH